MLVAGVGKAGTITASPRSSSERFFIDHGTGVVIGETTRIGRNVASIKA